MRRKFAQIIFFTGCFLLIATLVGCDAFVRKFTRKQKKEDLPREEMVLAPEEYKPIMDKEQLYRQYFLFWKSWHDELINSLSYSSNHKKQVDCTQEAIKSLVNLRALLNADMQKKLDVYISKLKDLKELIARDVYSNNISVNVKTAEHLKRMILRDFSFNKIKKYLI